MLKTITTAVLILSSCASASTNGGIARVYLFRGSGFWSQGTKASVYLDEALIAKMPANTVAVVELRPGLHVFRGVSEMNAVRLNLRRGNDYYLKMVMVEGNSVQVFHEVTAQEAKPIISKLKQLDQKDLVKYLRQNESEPAERER